VTPEALLDLFLLSPVGLVDVDEHGRVEVANLAARRLLTPFTSTGSLDDRRTSNCWRPASTAGCSSRW